MLFSICSLGDNFAWYLLINNFYIIPELLKETELIGWMTLGEMSSK